MIKEFIQRFNERKQELEEHFIKKPPQEYLDIVRAVVTVISNGRDGDLDPSRIHEIDDGDYQGTLLYLIADNKYLPSKYWFVMVEYGSCSGCDTLEDIKDSYSLEKQIPQYLTLALHVAQKIKQLE